MVIAEALQRCGDFKGLPPRLLGIGDEFPIRRLQRLLAAKLAVRNVH